MISHFNLLFFHLPKRKSKLISIKMSKQREKCENRNDPDLVQAFLKKWVVESDFKVDGVGSRKMFQPPH
jgi:hypothetical protein